MSGFFLVIVMCSSLSRNCYAQTMPAVYPTLDDCNFAIGATSKVQSNGMEVKDGSCIVAPGNPMIAETAARVHAQQAAK